MASLGIAALSLWSSPVVSAPTAVPPVHDNASCESCHQAEWKQWQDSRHAEAGENAPFNFEYEGHPGDWCLNCHAPRMKADKLPKKQARKQGVDCLSCHVKEGKLYSTSRSTESPHKTIADASFGETTMCASCHQFNFPELDHKGSLIRYTEQPMQDTANEFRRSSVAKAGGSCTDCHMPKGSHSFPGAYSPKQVQKALEIELCKRPSSVQVTIHNELLAHNLPSGGVNRALVVQLWDKASPSAKREYRLERRFVGPIGKRVKTKDTTLGPGESATWQVRRSYLGSRPPTELHLRSQFFLGTDPNRHKPTRKVDIEHQKIPWTKITECDSK